MNMLNNKSWLLFLIFYLMINSLCSCSYPYSYSYETTGNSTNDTDGYTEFIPAMPGNYDSQDTAIVVNINDKNQTMQLKTLSINKYYTLNYDGATTFNDKYGQSIALSQVCEGDIVNVFFMKERKRLDNLSESNEIFSFEECKEYTIYDGGNKVAIGNEVYSISEDIEVISDGREGDIADINSVDILTFKGFNHTVDSIIVERGHGYLRLANADYFLGGFIGVEDKLVYPIDENDMLYTVPAGTYKVSISNKGSVGTEEITINAGEEYEWDVKKWQGEEEKGWILFIVDPEDATVYIDKEKVNVTNSIELSYGIHQLIAIKSGYKTISKYIKVGSSSAEINITMEPQASSSDNSVISDNNIISDNSVLDISRNDINDNKKNNDVSTNDISVNDIKAKENKNKPEPGKVDLDENDSEELPKVPDSKFSDTEILDGVPKVTVNSPEEVEVYVDGKYIGISPVSFKKKAGTIVISLRKNGCQTRSYTLEIDDSDADVNYSFSELLEI